MFFKERVNTNERRTSVKTSVPSGFNDAWNRPRFNAKTLIEFRMYFPYSSSVGERRARGHDTRSSHPTSSFDDRSIIGLPPSLSLSHFRYTLHRRSDSSRKCAARLLLGWGMAVPCALAVPRLLEYARKTTTRARS